MAQFTEEAAAEILQKHNLPKTYLNKWRFNKRIPDKYLPSKPDRAAELEKEILRKKLASKKLNITAMCQYAGLERRKVENFVRGRDDITDNYILELKKILSHVKIEVKKIVEIFERLPVLPELKAKELRSFLDKRYIFIQVILGVEISGKINKWKAGKRDDFPAEHKTQLLQELLILLAEL